MSSVAMELLYILLTIMPSAAIGSPTAQVPSPYEAYPVKHYGPIPASTACFSNGDGVLHAWMNVLATTFCQKINNWEFDSYRNNTATAIWTTVDYPYNAAYEVFRNAWEYHPPNSVLLQVGVSPGCHTEVALTLYEAECREAFGVVIDDCQTGTFDGKLGGQLMLGAYTNLYWGTDQLYYTIDADYGSGANQYYSLQESTGMVDIIYAAEVNAFNQMCC